MNNNDYDRFSLTPEGFNIVDEGEIFKKDDFEEYFATKKRMMLKIENELKIGDVVMLQTTNNIVTVDKINVEFNGKIIAKYGGKKWKSDSNELVLFNQEDIEEILFQYNVNQKESSDELSSRKIR